ncbi:MAG: glycerophosphoryl diester phosphodiesterase membrane domain-containing protein [archaeon]|nr:glycerophosphoryl diester phosphodiesterase membrane domain-containing protein [archaeon]
MEIIETIKNSLTIWTKNKETKKIAVILFILQFGLGLISIGAHAYFLGDAFSSCCSFDENPFEMSQEKLNVNLMLVPIVLLYSIISLFFYFKIILVALKQFSVKTPELKTKKFVKAIVAMAVSYFGAIFSVFEKKFLLIPLAIIALVIADFSVVLPNEFVLPTAFVLGGLLIAYLIVIIRAVVRLVFSVPVILTSDADIAEAVSESWKITKGKELKMFIAFATLIVISSVVSYVFMFIFSNIFQQIGTSNSVGIAFSILIGLITSAISVWYTVSNNYLIAIFYKELKEN